MVVLIRRMLLPLIRKYFRLFLSMIVVYCLGIALMAGLSGAFYALENGFSDYLDIYGYANVCITTSPAPKQLCKELGSLEGVLQADGRMAADFPLKAGGYQLTVRVFSFSPDSEQRFYVREETEASGTLPELYVEADFAQANGIASGDELELKLANTYQKFQVQKIVSTPEAISTVQNAYFWGNNSDFGYVYLPEEYMKMVFGSDQFVCQFLLKVDAKHDETTVLEDARKILQQYQILDCFTSEDSPVRQRIETNLEPLQALSLLLPPLFFAVMLLVIWFQVRSDCGTVSCPVLLRDDPCHRTWHWMQPDSDAVCGKSVCTVLLAAAHYGTSAIARLLDCGRVYGPYRTAGCGNRLSAAIEDSAGGSFTGNEIVFCFDCTAQSPAQTAFSSFKVQCGSNASQRKTVYSFLCLYCRIYDADRVRYFI